MDTWVKCALKERMHTPDLEYFILDVVGKLHFLCVF